MFGRVFVSSVGLALLCGCSLIPGNELRYGPAQQVDVADVQAQMTRQNDVMKAFASAAGYGATKDEGPVLSITGDGGWYGVTLVGYNYVDEQCDAYLRQLFVWEREKGRIKDGLVQADKLTGAILTASSVHGSTIQVIAQAFGFGSTMTTILADSYLYAVPLPTIFATEEKMRKAYRDAAARQAKQIDSRAAAYQSVRGYLSLCFPQTIEAKMIGAVNSASVSAASAAGSTTTDAAKATKPTKTVAPAAGASTMIEVTVGN